MAHNWRPLGLIIGVRPDGRPAIEAMLRALWPARSPKKAPTQNAQHVQPGGVRQTEQAALCALAWEAVNSGAPVHHHNQQLTTDTSSGGCPSVANPPAAEPKVAAHLSGYLAAGEPVFRSCQCIRAPIPAASAAAAGPFRFLEGQPDQQQRQQWTQRALSMGAFSPPIAGGTELLPPIDSRSSRKITARSGMSCGRSKEYTN